MDWHKENKKIEQNDKTAIETIYIQLFKSTLKVSSQIAWKVAYFENIFWDFSGLIVPKKDGSPKAHVSNFQKTSMFLKTLVYNNDWKKSYGDRRSRSWNFLKTFIKLNLIDLPPVIKSIFPIWWSWSCL